MARLPHSVPREHQREREKESVEETTEKKWVGLSVSRRCLPARLMEETGSSGGLKVGVVVEH